ncbi:hypothetical protein JCM10207_007588 [Rhodosporidiobolus poonsookiae]
MPLPAIKLYPDETIVKVKVTSFEAVVTVVNSHGQTRFVRPRGWFTLEARAPQISTGSSSLPTPDTSPTDTQRRASSAYPPTPASSTARSAPTTPEAPTTSRPLPKRLNGLSPLIKSQGDQLTSPQSAVLGAEISVLLTLLNCLTGDPKHKDEMLARLDGIAMTFSLAVSERWEKLGALYNFSLTLRRLLYLDQRIKRSDFGPLAQGWWKAKDEEDVSAYAALDALQKGLNEASPEGCCFSVL